MIKFEINNSIKRINNQSFEDIKSEINDENTNVEILYDLFNNSNSEDELITNLKEISKTYKNKLTILKFIMYVGNLSISDANIILDKVFED